ncbi:ATP synthase-coupling factor 6, mitochondrial-like [Ctenocephalides felis]|uniref:ATP synthase-coupling factor 6, mitochondrial-like n=1 Tax=Ctenocephalides felis TaxID=7515 RepID=UPI000E6E56CA|nr:ATP synthase-coupling factor 6, mitochondrial-like [Ctenocephalides felis]
MMSSKLIAVRKSLVDITKRGISTNLPALQKADPIQQAFVAKLKEYKQKGGSGTKLVEPTPQIQHELKQELDKVAKQYGGAEGEDMTKFPSFTFPEPKVDPISATA